MNVETWTAYIQTFRTNLMFVQYLNQVISFFIKEAQQASLEQVDVHLLCCKWSREVMVCVWTTRGKIN